MPHPSHGPFHDNNILSIVLVRFTRPLEFEGSIQVVARDLPKNSKTCTLYHCSMSQKQRWIPKKTISMAREKIMVLAKVLVEQQGSTAGWILVTAKLIQYQ